MPSRVLRYVWSFWREHPAVGQNLAGPPTRRPGRQHHPVGEVTYRLDGIDAPELDQICIDDHADAWSCGVDARDQLAKLVGGHVVHCEDRGPDTATRKRHLGICTVEGETTSLNQLWSVGLCDEPRRGQEPVRRRRGHGQRRSQGDLERLLRRPAGIPARQKDGALLGGACPADKDREIRSVLFPEISTMPPRCTIKAKFAVRARVTGNVGIYHLQGCRSYPAMTRPDRWFCSEDDAQAAGFRRAYNCRAGK